MVYEVTCFPFALSTKELLYITSYENIRYCRTRLPFAHFRYKTFCELKRSVEPASGKLARQEGKLSLSFRVCTVSRPAPAAAPDEFSNEISFVEQRNNELR